MLIASINSNSASTLITVNFIAANTLLSSSTIKYWSTCIDYLNFVFPKCSSVPSFSSGACSIQSSVVISAGFSSSASCIASNNQLAISNVYSNYANSKFTTLAFSVSLSAAHTCTDSDYIYVYAMEPNKKKSAENAVVISDSFIILASRA